MNLGLNSKLAYPSNANRKGGFFAYYIRDSFTDNLSVGAINGTPSVPGPGIRDIIDTNSVLSLSGGSAVVSSGGVANTPRIIYAPVILARGMLCRVVFNHSATTEVLGMGFWSAYNQSPGLFRTVSGGNVTATFSSNVVVGTFTTGVHEYVVVMRCPGRFYFIKDPSTNKYRMLAFNNISDDAGSRKYVGFGTRGTSAMNCQLIEMPTQLWLPTPLVSDGFSGFGTTDGLGHQEGVSGGLGTGGNGLAWTQNVGTWTAASGKAKAASLTGSLAIATVDAGKTDVLVTVKLTVSAGSNALVLRFVDNSNFVLIRRTSTNVQISKIIGGSETSVLDTVVTYVADAELVAVCGGTGFRLFYNNAAVGSEQTISDAILQTGTRVGIRSTDVNNTFDDFIAYARGSDNEYSILGTL